MTAVAKRTGLAAVVESALGKPVRSVRSWPHPYRTSHPLVAVDADLDDGRIIRAVVKETLARPAIRPAFVHRPDREREVYRKLLRPSTAPAPCLLGVAGAHIVLERVAGVPLWEIGDEAAASAAGRAVRAMHDALAERTDAPFLLRYDRRFLERWLRRASLLDPTLGSVVDAYERAVDRLIQEPRIVIHGELYPSNVLVRDDAVSIVDWETTAVGPAAVDLAALVSGWPEPHAQAALAAYGPVDPMALECARLHLAVRWLGWSPRWTPPTEHARDWRAEVLQGAARIRRGLA